LNQSNEKLTFFHQQNGDLEVTEETNFLSAFYTSQRWWHILKHDEEFQKIYDVPDIMKVGLP